MKVFVGRNISCSLNYELLEVLNKLKGKVEIVEDVELADAIIFHAFCSCTAQRIYDVICYMSSIIKEKNEGIRHR